MSHDQENERNEKWLRSILDGLNASNSSAEAMAQRLYEHAWKKTPSAAFEKQSYGAVVATIHQTDDGLLEVLDVGDGTFNLIVHQRRGETDAFDDLSIRLEPKHFALLGSIAPKTALM